MADMDFVNEVEMEEDDDVIILEPNGEDVTNMGVSKMAPGSVAPQAQKKAKSAGSKNSKRNQSCPKISDMVASAIKNLNEKRGSSLQAIKNYIVANYKVDLDNLSLLIKQHLKVSVRSGELLQAKRKGTFGFFRLASSDSVASSKSPKNRSKKAVPAKKRKKEAAIDKEKKTESTEKSGPSVEKEKAPSVPPSLAEIKKEKGNEFYKTKEYKKAIPFYTEAIQLCPESASYYGNRAACYMMLNQYGDALDDARKSVLIDGGFVKGYVRIAKCSLALGDLITAENAIARIKELDPKNTAIAQESSKIETIKRWEEEIKKAEDKEDNRKILFCLDRILEQIPCTKYKLRKAECLVFLRRYQEAKDIVSPILLMDNKNVDAIFVRGLCFYYEDNTERAFTHFQHVLRLAPDHKKAKDVYKKAKLLNQKKEEGNAAFNQGKWNEAFKLYTEALQIDSHNVSTNAKLFSNRATVSLKLGNLQKAVDDCTSALYLDETYLKALLRRAKCYMDLGEYEEAVKDYENAVKLDKSRETKRLLMDAKAALKNSKRKDYYKILGIDRNASSDDIKKAYRKRALVHHPDRHANASEGEKKEQEKKFKEVGEAYGILSDPKKKSRYDSGQDLEDSDLFDHFDPNQVFHAFFQGGGHHHFSSDAAGFSFHFG